MNYVGLNWGFVHNLSYLMGCMACERPGNLQKQWEKS